MLQMKDFLTRKETDHLNGHVMTQRIYNGFIEGVTEKVAVVFTAVHVPARPSRNFTRVRIQQGMKDVASFVLSGEWGEDCAKYATSIAHKNIVELS